MKLLDTDETILIITGSDVAAEMNDRPTAYGLKAEIDRAGAGKSWRGALVASDRWYADNRLFHLCSTVVVGGPGVNAVAAALIDELPRIVTRDDRVFVQGSWNEDKKRVLLWGMDRTATAEAVRIFLRDGYCADFLNHAWRLKAGVEGRIDLA